MLDIDLPDRSGLEIAGMFEGARKKYLERELAQVLADCEKELAAREERFHFRADGKDVAVLLFSLWFMPEWMGGVLRFTPFSSIYFTPVQIYLGQLAAGEILRSFAVQLLWIAVFAAFGMILWKKGLKKLVVQGG